MTVLDATSATDLGIALQDGNFAVIKGIGGGLVDTYVHRVQMRLGTKRFECRIAFATTDTVPMILGRADVFATFKVCYDDVKQLTEFDPQPRRVKTQTKRKQ
jgi:hypothetical protein